MKRIHPRLALALVLALVLLYASGFARLARREMDLWRRARAAEQQLRDQSRELLAERRALEASVTRPAASPEELVSVYLPGRPVVFEPATVQELPQGFRHRTVELAFTAVPWEELRHFVEKAGAQSPPWRVTGLEIRAGRRHLDGSLRLEALDKTEAVD